MIFCRVGIYCVEQAFFKYFSEDRQKGYRSISLLFLKTGVTLAAFLKLTQSQQKQKWPQG